MEPNTKLWGEDLMKQIREEIKASFAAHESFINMSFSKMVVSGQQCDERVTALESAASELDKSLAFWKMDMDSSLTVVKLNSYFNCDAKVEVTPKLAVLPHGSTTVFSSAVLPTHAPNGHHVDIDHHDC
jgi:hypothetical protein